jgi:hypothetical protein
VPSGAIPHALSNFIYITVVSLWQYSPREQSAFYILDELIPVCLVVKPVLIVAAKVRVELFARHELE